MKVRIGIDVGGTFTDAVAINNDTFELMGSIKIPTTHAAAEGVAAGIIEALHKIMSMYNIASDDVVFIAHGTTQATNALLEGDVAQVGVLTLGHGLEGLKSKSDTNIGNITLAAGKFLKSHNQYVDTSDIKALNDNMTAAVKALASEGATSIVAAEAFSVDNPENEQAAALVCRELGLPGTATNNISKLYGLKLRTRTAVINASIMPKMLDAANMTEQSILNANVKSPLMVMRCDGGVMSVDEVRNRPIMTILSGPAAGVAGALMYEKLTDGIFLEVGGTSTDISCVKDGKVMIRYAQVGGHKTYLNSLDVRTVGIGGGSMVELSGGIAIDVGPRSAHIAGLAYEVYSAADDIVNPKLIEVTPKEGDPPYACIECAGGKRFALTLAGAANIAGYVPEGDYAYGSVESARKAWQPLAQNMGCSVEEAAEKVLDFSSVKNGSVVKQLMRDYNMDVRTTTLVGGGGGASVVVSHLGKKLEQKHAVARNAPVISTIGVALAMVRDMVERTITNPTDQDIISIRREAELKAISSGAAPGTVEVSINVDTQRSLVRAVAIGATEMRSKNLLERVLDKPRLLEIVAENMDIKPDQLRFSAENGSMYAVQADFVKKTFFGLMKKKTCPMRLVDEEGVIRLQKKDALVSEGLISEWEQKVAYLLNKLTVYDEGGETLPNLYIVVGKRIIDLSGLANTSTVYSLGTVELAGYSPGEPLIFIATKRNV